MRIIPHSENCLWRVLWHIQTAVVTAFRPPPVNLLVFKPQDTVRLCLAHTHIQENRIQSLWITLLCLVIASLESQLKSQFFPSTLSNFLRFFKVIEEAVEKWHNLQMCCACALLSYLLFLINGERTQFPNLLATSFVSGVSAQSEKAWPMICSKAREFNGFEISLHPSRV